jgi:hypothetical protein
MGISQQEAPSCFQQQQLATEVLRDLLYQKCELYIDDIIPFAANEDEFVVNVRDIFSRLRQFQINNFFF